MRHKAGGFLKEERGTVGKRTNKKKECLNVKMKPIAWYSLVFIIKKLNKSRAGDVAQLFKCLPSLLARFLLTSDKLKSEERASIEKNASVRS